MDMITLIVGGACLLYYALIAVYAGVDVNFGWFWIALGCAFLVVYFASRSPVRVIRIGAGALLCILAAGLLILAVQSAQVIAGMSQKDTGGTDYVIVLGAEVKGTRPSRSLLMRLQKAEEYAKENPDTTLILSGGQGSGEDISEAQCMYEYLTTRGIPGAAPAGAGSCPTASISAAHCCWQGKRDTAIRWESRPVLTLFCRYIWSCGRQQH